jgi:adenylate cyclase class 2
MAAPQEVEIKFLIPDVNGLEQKLIALLFRCITPSTREVNTLYDLPSQELRSKGQLLRLRQYGDKWILTHKGKGIPGPHKSRTELETGVSDGPKMDSILRTLGYGPTFVYEKYRSEWSDGHGHVVLDRTPIGDVAEIEGESEWIDRTAQKLGVSTADYITKSYVELFFEWKRRTNRKAENMTFQEVGDDPISH